MRPCASTLMSLKSRRLRHWFEPPASQMQPRCTGSVGVASTVVHVTPPSSVVAIYRCQTPANDDAWSSPPVVVPRNANAARLSSPAIISGNCTLLMPNAAPTFCTFVHVAPRSCETAANGLLPVLLLAPSSHPK